MYSSCKFKPVKLETIRSMILSHMVTDLSSLSASNGHRACNYKELMNNIGNSMVRQTVFQSYKCSTIVGHLRLYSHTNLKFLRAESVYKIAHWSPRFKI